MGSDPTRSVPTRSDPNRSVPTGSVPNRSVPNGSDPSGGAGLKTSALEIGASIRKELAVQIPTYMLPRKVHVVEQLPLTPNGKTDRRALAARVQAPSA